jgi:hypothetical protein
MKNVQVQLNDGRLATIGKRKVCAGLYRVNLLGMVYEVKHIPFDTFGERNTQPWYIGVDGQPADDTYNTLNDAISAYYRGREQGTSSDCAIEPVIKRYTIEEVKQAISEGRTVYANNGSGGYQVVDVREHKGIYQFVTTTSYGEWSEGVYTYELTEQTIEISGNVTVKMELPHYTGSVDVNRKKDT